MSLTDIMSHLDLHIWAEVAMVIFLVVFVLVVARVFMVPRSEIMRISSLPLEDDNGECFLDGGE